MQKDRINFVWSDHRAGFTAGRLCNIATAGNTKGLGGMGREHGRGSQKRTRGHVNGRQELPTLRDWQGRKGAKTGRDLAKLLGGSGSFWISSASPLWLSLFSIKPITILCSNLHSVLHFISSLLLVIITCTFEARYYQSKDSVHLSSGVHSAQTRQFAGGRSYVSQASV